MFAMMACIVTGSWLIFRAAGGIAAFPEDVKAAFGAKAMDELTKLLQSGPDVAKMLVPCSCT